MKSEPKKIGKFVRLNLTGETVELERLDLNYATIKYRGQSLMLRHDEISPLPEHDLNPPQAARFDEQWAPAI